MVQLDCSHAGSTGRSGPYSGTVPLQLSHAPPTTRAKVALHEHPKHHEAQPMCPSARPDATPRGTGVMKAPVSSALHDGVLSSWYLLPWQAK